MEINWFTVVAQLINFIALVWLMKKYLYKPILQAVDEREKTIALSLSEAKASMVEAKKERDDFRKKNDEFDLSKNQLLVAATADAAEQKQKILDAAKENEIKLKAKLEATSAEFLKNMTIQFVTANQQKVILITKKALGELASTTLEEQSVGVFIGKLERMPTAEKTRFIAAFHSESIPISVRSAFELTDQNKKNIQSAISDILGIGCKYQFETDKKMIGGLELSVTGYKLSWSFSAYINALEKNISSLTHKVDYAV